ncbi:unnamed protein product [Dibothriocephalus latus]|uniref:RING-type domain-containing protein n=1 Tax=Dibothriocephalus latus TaxID=60516 RepID=A0A3P6UZ57_DIBLA|nr:unnamed protein product [Dibothriocephalus latus]
MMVVSVFGWSLEVLLPKAGVGETVVVVVVVVVADVVHIDDVDCGGGASVARKMVVVVVVVKVRMGPFLKAAGEFAWSLLHECCREFIASNIPSIDCAICFDAFQREEDVYRSRCDHFFHKECIFTYHMNLTEEYSRDLAEILSKNPHCPLDFRPKLKFPCPLCKTNLPQVVRI